jgi:hypothetical protein
MYFVARNAVPHSTIATSFTLRRTASSWILRVTGGAGAAAFSGRGSRHQNANRIPAVKWMMDMF